MKSGKAFKSVALMAPSNLWQGPQLRRHLERLKDNLELLQAVSIELQVIAAVRAEEECVPGQLLDPQVKLLVHGDARKQYLHRLLSHRLSRSGSNAINEAESVAVQAASSLQSTIQMLLCPLQGVLDGSAPWDEIAAASRFRDRRMKLKRNRKRRQRKRQEAAEIRNKADERFQQADQLAEEWRQREIAKDTARKKIEKLNELSEKKAKAERMQLEEELGLALMVEKLQELRAVRVQKLKKQGCLFPEEDDQFMERVRAAVEEEERQAAVAAADTTRSTAEVSVEDAAANAPNVEEASSSSRGKSEAITGKRFSTGKDRGLPAKFASYYFGSSRDMETLIEVRRSWDTYLTPDGGSRIPGHWVQPSPPSSDVWASYLLKGAPEDVERTKKNLRNFL